MKVEKKGNREVRSVKNLFGLLVALAVACGAFGSAFAYERVPSEIVKALGTVRGKAVSTGLVFIDGKYVKPPYRVTRAGNQILVNDRPVTGQLVLWEKLLETQPPSKLKVTEVEVPADAPPPEPAEKQAPEKDGIDPAAPKDGGNTPPPPAPSTDDDLFSQTRVRIVETRYAADADDLEDFKPDASGKMKLTDIPADSAEDKARQKRAEEEKEDDEEEDSKEEEGEKESKDDGSGEGAAANASGKDENGDEYDPASPEGEAVAKAKVAAEKKARPAVKTRKVTTLEGAFEMNFRVQKYVKAIDAYRTRIEATLRRGGFIFFGTNPSRKYCHGLRSDAVMTNELLKKLPELMAKAGNSEGFCDAVRTAGLMSYLNLQISQDLFRHKMDSIFLKQRRREIAEGDKLNRMVNGRGR